MGRKKGKPVPDSAKSTFGARLRFLFPGVSAEGISERIGKITTNEKPPKPIGITTIYNWLDGKSCPPSKILSRIAEITECDASWLLGSPEDYDPSGRDVFIEEVSPDELEMLQEDLRNALRQNKPEIKRKKNGLDSRFSCPYCQRPIEAIQSSKKQPPGPRKIQ